MPRLLAPALAVALLALPLAFAGNAYDSPSAGDATGWNTQRKVARAADGSVFWTYLAPAADGAFTEVAVARERPDGTLEELPRPRGAKGDASRPSLALDAAGALHVAWTERAEDDREVFHAVLRDGRWADVAQLSGGLGYAGFPSLAADAEGRVHVSWYGFDGTVYQAFYRRLVDGTWEPAVQLSSGSLDANNPSTLVDAGGTAHVVWYKDDGRLYRIWHAVRLPNGSFTHPAAVPAATDAEVDAFNAALAMDAEGRVHVVWDERHPDGFWIAHSTWSPGSGWSRPSVLARGDVGGEYPAIAAWRDGVLVTWAQRDTGVLLGTDLSGAPRPILGGVEGRNPSLRGPMPVPESEGADVLDVLYAARQPEGDWHVVHAALPSSCDVFEALSACEGATRVEVEPAALAGEAPAAPSGPGATPGGASGEGGAARGVPSPGWAPLAGLAVAAAVLLTRGCRSGRAR